MNLLYCAGNFLLSIAIMYVGILFSGYSHRFASDNSEIPKASAGILGFALSVMLVLFGLFCLIGTIGEAFSLAVPR